MSYSYQGQDVRNPVTERGAATKHKLLAAAEKCFGEKGFYPTSIADITREAGVAQGTFYVYFDSKEAILRALVHHLGHELRRESAQAIAGAPSRAEAERRGFQAFFRWVARHRNSYRIVRQAEFVDQDIFRWYYRKLAEGYARGLERAMGTGEIARADPEVLAYCLMGIGDFVGMRYVLWEEEEGHGDGAPAGGVPQPVFEEVMRFILGGLKKGGE